MRRLARRLTLASACLWLAAAANAQDALPAATPPSPASPSPQPDAPAATAPSSPEAAPAPPSVAADPASAPIGQAAPTLPDQTVVLDPKAPAKTEINLDRRSQVTAGVGVSGPIGAAASLRLLYGMGADVKDGSTSVKAVCAAPIPHCAQGFLLQVDGGSGGGKLSLGLGARAKVDDEGFRGTAGFALRVALARTWGHPIGTDPGLTYLGPELDLSVLRIGLTLGVLFRIDGDHGAGTLFSWGLGFGL